MLPLRQPGCMGTQVEARGDESVVDGGQSEGLQSLRQGRRQRLVDVALLLGGSQHEKPGEHGRGLGLLLQFGQRRDTLVAREGLTGAGGEQGVDVVNLELREGKVLGEEGNEVGVEDRRRGAGGGLWHGSTLCRGGAGDVSRSTVRHRSRCDRSHGRGGT